MAHPLLDLRPSPSAGLGLFANQDIPPGTLLLSTPPLLVIHKPPSALKDADIASAIDSLTPHEQAQFYALADPPTHHKQRATRILRGNGVAYPAPLTTSSNIPPETHTALSPALARMNHSCAPNVDLAIHPHTHRLELFASRPLPRGAEATFSYLSSISCMPRSYRRFLLWLNWRFDCACPACAASEEAVEASDGRRAGIYELRAGSRQFSLPVLSGKAVLRMGVPVGEVWGPGELQRVLKGLWLPPQGGLGLRGKTGLEGWREVVRLVKEEGVVGWEGVGLIREAVKGALEVGGMDHSEVRMWVDLGKEMAGSCRNVGHPDLLELDAV